MFVMEMTHWSSKWYDLLLAIDKLITNVSPSQVKTVEDFDDPEAGFLPEMCHQIYGDNENIFGYKGLKVKLYMSAGSLESFVTHEFDDKVDPAKTDGVTADDVISPLVKILAPGSFTDSKDQFLAYVNSEKETQFRYVPQFFVHFH